ncbi:YitT family protein [Klebsiella aerogenes]|uniref:YitT family protein n=1 Tax=Klebsiella aerogenes TaxID=548 RepID=UPI001C2373B8|nr:YitT family protein [Klebsiella aerogenes]QXA73931.1 YitT family protein [Klebsiella aerogenes]
MTTLADYPRHTAADDFYGLFTGVALAAMGIAALGAGGLITGGAAGMALLLSYLVPWTPAQLVPVINLPFIAFGFFAMGRMFAAKTLAVSLSLGVAVHVCAVMLLPTIAPITAAVFGSIFLGIGILFMARHGASIGGTGIVTLWGQRRFNVNAGLSQCAFDAVLFVVAAFSQPWDKLAISFVGVVIMNSCLIFWHKPGRYRG